jgi:multisubunit Na+/H+ antiporter MnhB subunit
MDALTALAWTFDGVIGIGIVGLAGYLLLCEDITKSVVLFVAFGLLMALAWVRLDAPDIALAEAAIGAGLTGALLFIALSRLRLVQRDRTTAPADRRPRLRGVRLVALFGVLLIAAGLGSAILSLPAHAPGLAAEVSANLGASGVGNPVTAVLLNFRGYDTLLELFVLLLAVLGVWSLGGAALSNDAIAGPVLSSLTRLLTPVLLLVAAYLVWAGADSPGGAFQAGSVLGAAGVLLLLSGHGALPARMALPLRALLLAGPGMFLLMAAGMVLLEGKLLFYPPEHAGRLILLLETVATVSIGATLATLFLGGDPATDEEGP